MAVDALVSEETALLKIKLPNGKRAWPAQRVTMIVVNALVYLVSVMPLALPSPLAPTFETDMGLGWTKVDTKLFLSRTLLMEGVGVCCLGWLPDHIGGSSAMVVYLAIAATFLTVIASIDDPETIIGLWACLGFVRGVAWPAAMKITSDYLAGSQWLVSICMVGMASRIGDAMTSEFFGLFVNRHGWRSAILFISAAQFVGAICLALASGITHFDDSNTADAPTRSESPNSGSLSAFSRVKAFYSMPDTWLMTFVAMGQQSFWVLCGYLASFAHGIYATETSTSALIQGLFPAGQFVGLGCALMLTLIMRDSKKTIYFACVLLSVMSVMIPLVIRFSHLPLEAFAVFTALEGFSVVLIDYIPATVWCMHVGHSSGDSSLFMGVMFGATFVVGFIGSHITGHLRTISEDTALNFALGNSIVGGSICTLLLAIHIRRQLQHIRESPGVLVSREDQSLSA